MDTAIVTGASSGIGLAISKVLLQNNYIVYGLGRDFSKVSLKDENFKAISCDLLETNKVFEIIKNIKKTENIKVLVNNAGAAYFGLHEELNTKKIHEMVTTNLEIPLCLTQLLLRDMKKNKGYIINISSVTAKKSSPHGCAYGATKAAISHFSTSLFDECRKYGVKVVCIHPDIVKSNFYRNADFKEGESFDSFITPEEVAEAVNFALKVRDGLSINEISLSPQKNRISKKTKAAE